MDTTRDPILPQVPKQDASPEEIERWRTDLTNIVKDLHNNVYDDIVGNVIPIGFIYVQFPGKDDPLSLFGFGTWENVSDDFAGDFFRAEGGSASEFESGEQADATALPTSSFTTGDQSASHNHSVTGGAHYHLLFYGTVSSTGLTSSNYPAASRMESADTDYSITGYTSGPNIGRSSTESHSHTVGNQSASHSHTVTGGGDSETRPVNRTIRIWERTA